MTASGLALVEIGVDPDVSLRGHFWPGTATWIVLLHDVGEDHDLDAWQSLVPALRPRGWSVLAVDLRGHGASDGKWEPERAEGDLAAIVSYARAAGAVRVFLVAAGETALLALATSGAIEPDALVLLSPTIDESAATTPFRGAGQSRLIICGGADPGQRQSAERLRNAAIGWAAILNLPATDAGTALLDGPYGSHAREQIRGFLAEQEFLTRR